MSKPRIRSGAMHGSTPAAAQCQGKDSFPNGTVAYRVANKTLGRKWKGNKGGLSIYRCPHCGKFHIGGMVQ